MSPSAHFAVILIPIQDIFRCVWLHGRRFGAGLAVQSSSSQTELLRRSTGSSPTSAVLIEVAAGEIIDKITILEIKCERIGNPGKLSNVQRELDALRLVRDRSIASSQSLLALSAELRCVNEAIWNIEDEIRVCERIGEFGPRFIELARGVYKNNDHRAALKRKINELLNSRIVEEKVVWSRRNTISALRLCFRCPSRQLPLTTRRKGLNNISVVLVCTRVCG